MLSVDLPMTMPINFGIHGRDQSESRVFYSVLCGLLLSMISRVKGHPNEYLTEYFE